MRPDASRVIQHRGRGGDSKMREPAAILCIVVVAICGLGIKGGAQPDYPTVSFNLKDNPTWSRYRDFMWELREIVIRGATSTRSGATVLRPAENVPDQERFVLVRLTNYNDNTATLAVDVVNLYVVAFLVNYRAYFFSDATPLQTNNLFVGTPRTLLTYTGSYNDLQQQAGATREHIALGPTALGNAITELGANNDRTRATSIIVVIQMVSEAARFRHIEVRIWESIAAANTFFPNARILSMENSWSAMSLEVQQSVDGLIFFRSIRLEDEPRTFIDVDNFNTLSRYTMVAVLLYRCRQPTATTSGSYGYSNNNINNVVIAAALLPTIAAQVIRMPVVHLGDQEDETCAIQEPTKRIIGRDGLCVDVRGEHDYDGNSILLWPCGDQRNQQWTFHRDGTIRSMGKCMTTFGFSPGVIVMIYNCSTAVADATKWTVSVDGTIANPYSGLVLTAPEAAMGTTLLVEKNVHDARQGWTVGNAEPIVTYIMGMMNMMCLEAKNENSALWLEDCVHNRAQQKWALYSDGTIRVDSDRSLCVTSDGDVPLATIIILKCQGSRNQRWVFNNTDLAISNPNSELVMDVKASDVSLHQIILYKHIGGTNQQWLTHTNPFE